MTEALVVVGVDGSPESSAALEHALHDADRRSARLRVVAAVQPPVYWPAVYGPIPVAPTPQQLDEAEAEVRGWVDEAVLRARVEVPVEVLAVSGGPARVLVDAAADADLLVLGHRGRGALASAVLGSVGLACVLHAPCPVTIVRPQR